MRDAASIQELEEGIRALGRSSRDLQASIEGYLGDKLRLVNHARQIGAP